MNLRSRCHHKPVVIPTCPEGAKQTSPGQRPGERPDRRVACPERAQQTALVVPFQGETIQGRTTIQRRCPGLVCLAPSGQVARALAVVVLLVFSPTSYSQIRPVDTEPPVANRVEPFSGAVGRKFAVTMSAEPLELLAGDTLTLTIRITADGAWQQPPKRPDLRRHEKYVRFPKSFHIENGDDRHDPAGPSWEFVYRLRPLSEGVTEVPRLPFVYFRPGQGYQTLSAPALPLTVRARSEVTAAEVQGPDGASPVPEQMFQLAQGTHVLERETLGVFPEPWILIVFALGIPCLCGGWYGFWRWKNPEAARVARQRRSRAAQRALHSLSRITPGDAEQQARDVSLVLAGYLKSRFDLPGATPTPDEVAAHLTAAGVRAETGEALRAFFAACDGVRFAGLGTDIACDWMIQARELILELEQVSCPSPIG